MKKGLSIDNNGWKIETGRIMRRKLVSWIMNIGSLVNFLIEKSSYVYY
jgi:hypothetical protein